MLERRWPSARQCGVFFDQLRTGALRFLAEDDPPDPSLSLEAMQVKNLVFRENADSLYASERPSIDSRQQELDLDLPNLDLDGLSLDQATGFLQFFDQTTSNALSPSPFNLPHSEFCNGRELGNAFFSSPNPMTSSPEGRPRMDIQINESRLQKAMTYIPVCSHCKARRVKCDIDLPSCRACSKAERQCYYFDHVIGKDILRRSVSIPMRLASELTF